jgi:tankyrase
MLLGAGADAGVKTVEGETPLHTAAAEGNVYVAELLLAARADPDIKDNLSRTPPHLVSCKGYRHFVRLLLKMGADPTVRDNKGNSPLDVAATDELKTVIKLGIGYKALRNRRKNREGGSFTLYV